MDNNFSYKTMVGKGVKYFLTFLVAAIPFFVQMIPPYITQMNLLDLISFLAPLLKTITVGSLLVMLLNWLKVKIGVRIP